MWDEGVVLLLEEHNFFYTSKMKNLDMLTNISIYLWFTSQDMGMKTVFISYVEES